MSHVRELPLWDKVVFAGVMVAILALAVTEHGSEALVIVAGGVYAELRMIRIFLGERNE